MPESSGDPDFFSADHAQAQARFRDLALARGARLANHPIAAQGPAGETLAIDAAYVGAAEPRALAVICAGTHGIEAFAGSALELLFLRDYAVAYGGETRAGVLLIHVLNPYGFAHRRRTNENNVDLNRNSLARFPGPPSPDYAELDPWLNPESPPGFIDGFIVQALRHVSRHGFNAVKQAIAGGQYDFPRGLFYGGTARQESLAVLARLLGDHRLQGAEMVLFIDLHTGLGRSGTYKLLVDFPTDSPGHQAMQTWFGAENVQTNDPVESVAYRASGLVGDLAAAAFPKAAVYPTVLEFGTYPLARILRALRAENRFHFHGDLRSRAGARIKDYLQESFCPASPVWRRSLLAHGRQIYGRLARCLKAP